VRGAESPARMWSTFLQLRSTPNKEDAMLKRSLSLDEPVAKITFALPLCDVGLATSVVGDFNGWNPLAHPLKKRSNGTRSVTVEMPVGAAYHFKYLSEDGTWFCDPAADAFEPNDFGAVNSVLLV
jgi:1,4-alpha-glucan branching enzyme